MKRSWNGVIPVAGTTFPVGLFSTTIGTDVFRLAGIEQSVFVKKVATPNQALACGAVVFYTSTEYLILPSAVVEELGILTEGMVRITPCAKFSSDVTSQGVDYGALRANPSYLFTATTATAVQYAGVVTRAVSCIGWNRLGGQFVGAPIANIPSCFSQVIQLAHDHRAVMSEVTPCDLKNAVATHPLRDRAWYVEIAALQPGLGVLDLFKTSAVQNAIADALGDADRFMDDALPGFVAQESNVGYPTPLMYVRDSSGLKYFGAGAHEVEGNKLVTPKVGNYYREGHSQGVGIGESYYSTLPLKDATGSNTVNFYGICVAAPRADRTSLGNVDANVRITRTGDDSGGRRTLRVIDGLQLGAPASCHEYGRASISQEMWLAYDVAPSAGTNPVTSLTEKTVVQTYRGAGARVANALPWLPVLNITNAVIPANVSDVRAGLGWAWADADGNAETGRSFVALGIRVAYDSTSVTRTNRIAPDTIEGKPAQHFLGGNFFGAYYNEKFALIATGGGAMSVADLLVQTPIIAELSYSRGPLDTTNLTEAQINALRQADDTAYAGWSPPKKAGYQTTFAAERWMVSQHSALGRLVDRFYDAVEKEAKDAK